MTLSVRRCLGVALVVWLVGFLPAASAIDKDKIDELTRTLLQDPSYKVRVQAAVVLGNVGDKRAVPALVKALKDVNLSVRGVAATSLGTLGDATAAAALREVANDPSEFVRQQANKALALLSSGPPPPPPPPPPKPRPGARYFVSVGFEAKTKVGPPQSWQLVHDVMTKEMGKMPTVTLAVSGGPPTVEALTQQKLKGYFVDGTIHRLATSRVGTHNQVDCELRAFLASWPDRSMKMTTSAAASVQVAIGATEEATGRRDCLTATVEAVREDIYKYLLTVK